MAKAMRCEYHFVWQYCEPNPTSIEVPSAPGAAGTAFHAYRAAYTDHLVAEEKWTDREWAYEWVATHSVPDEAVVIIQRDIETWSVNPASVFGSELFLSVDENFVELEREFGRTQGARSEKAMLSGTIDLLILDGSEARIVDAKSAYSATTISEEEAAIYCCLVFAHFPQIQSVVFLWDFVRLRAHKLSSYTRDDLPAMKQIVRDLVDLRKEYARDLQANEQLPANPWSGMCAFCSLRCPTLEHARDPERLVAIQNDSEARRLAQIIYVVSQFLAPARKMLSDYISAREDLPNGQLQLGGNFIAEISPKLTRELNLLPTLNGLGLAVVDMTGLPDEKRAELIQIQPAASTLFDIPLGRLELRGSALKGFANTKQSRAKVSRKGLAELLESLSPQRVIGGALRIRRVDERPQEVTGADEQ